MPAISADQRRRLYRVAAVRLAMTLDAVTASQGRDATAAGLDDLSFGDGLPMRAAPRQAARDAFELMRSPRAQNFAGIWARLADSAGDFIGRVNAGPAAGADPEDRKQWLLAVVVQAAGAILPALGRAGRGDAMVALARAVARAVTGERFVAVAGAGGLLENDARTRMILLSPVLWSLVGHLPDPAATAA